MTTTWDTGSYGVTNNTGQTMTLNDFALSSGKWTQVPAESIGNGQTVDPAFAAASRDDATYGPEGYVKYGLPDGTVLIIRFSVPYAGDEYLYATFEGPRAGQYKIDPYPPDEKDDGTGATKRVTGTVVAKQA